MLPKLGIEPRWYCYRWILSLFQQHENRLKTHENATTTFKRRVLQGITVLFCATIDLTKGHQKTRLFPVCIVIISVIMSGPVPGISMATRLRFFFFFAQPAPIRDQINVAGEVLNISASFFAISLLIARWPVS